MAVPASLSSRFFLYVALKKIKCCLRSIVNIAWVSPVYVGKYERVVITRSDERQNSMMFLVQH